MRIDFLLSVLILAFLLGSPAQGQVTIDATKITCDQFVHDKIGNRRTVAAWLAGFYSGKQNNAVVDIQRFQKNLNKLEHFCYNEKNFGTPIMQAIEQTIEAAK